GSQALACLAAPRSRAGLAQSHAPCRDRRDRRLARADAAAGPPPAALRGAGHGLEQPGALPRKSDGRPATAGPAGKPGTNARDAPAAAEHQPVLQRLAGDEPRLSRNAPRAVTAEPQPKRDGGATPGGGRFRLRGFGRAAGLPPLSPAPGAADR